MASVGKYLIDPDTVAENSGGRLHPRILVPSQRHFPERVANNHGSRSCEVRPKKKRHQTSVGTPVVSGPRTSSVYAKSLYVLTLASEFIIAR